MSTCTCISLIDAQSISWWHLITIFFIDQLSLLIRETRIRGVEFIYAIAPGLDIVFSDTKEVDALKKKLEQVQCRLF